MSDIKIINKKENIFGDNIAFIEQWDFSRANLNEENRIRAITQVASICYQNPKALNSDSLYNRLLAESAGLPSSSFEICAVLIDLEAEIPPMYFPNEDLHIFKYGEKVGNGRYLLTNFRAIIYDVENRKIHSDWLKYFNTEEECEIIKEHFKVFNFKVDLPTRSQMIRHRVNWQELSRRYVSGKRVPFDFYISENMKDTESQVEREMWYEKEDGSEASTTSLFTNTTQDVIEMCINHYYRALEDGVKPQEARRIIPQGAYTQIWGAFQPTQLENYFKLRLDSHSQWEIRQTAEAMKELINKGDN